MAELLEGGLVRAQTVGAEALTPGAISSVLESKVIGLRTMVSGFLCVAGQSAFDVTSEVTAVATDINPQEDLDTATGIFIGAVTSYSDARRVLLRYKGSENSVNDGSPNGGDDAYGVLNYNSETATYTLAIYKSNGTPLVFGSDTQIDFLFVEVFNLKTTPGGSALLTSSTGAIDHATASIAAQALSLINTHLSQSNGIHGVTGSVVGTTDSQVLSGKTLNISLNAIVGALGKVPQFNSSTGFLEASGISNSELNKLSGVTGFIQTQIDSTNSSLSAHTSASTGVHGIFGSVVGTTDAQSIQNKTIQTHLNSIQAPSSGRAAQFNSSTGDLEASSVTNQELSYLSGLTSSVQNQLNSVATTAITALSGDVSATGPGSVFATVVSVGGVLAALIASGATSANNATSSNLASRIVSRDSFGNFVANVITASLTGAASLNVLKTGDTMSGALQVQGSIDTVQLVVKGNSPQSNHLQDWKTSGNSVVASMDGLGNLTVNSTIHSSAAISTVPYYDLNKRLVSSSVTPTELSYLSGVSSSIQSQLNSLDSTLTDHINAFSNVHGVSGSVVGTSDAQNLSNKTLIDDSTFFANSLDPTKITQLNNGNVSSGQTRMISAADRNVFLDNITQEIVEQVTLTSVMVASRSIPLSSTPKNPSNTTLRIVGGLIQSYAANFIVTGNTLSWFGLGLDGYLRLNDIVVIRYQANG